MRNCSTKRNLRDLQAIEWTPLEWWGCFRLCCRSRYNKCTGHLGEWWAGKHFVFSGTISLRRVGSGVFPGEDREVKVKVAVSEKGKQWISVVCRQHREGRPWFSQKTAKSIPVAVWRIKAKRCRQHKEILACNGWRKTWHVPGAWVKGFIQSIIMNRLSSSRIRIHNPFII